MLMMNEGASLFKERMTSTGTVYLQEMVGMYTWKRCSRSASMPMLFHLFVCYYIPSSAIPPLRTLAVFSLGGHESSKPNPLRQPLARLSLEKRYSIPKQFLSSTGGSPAVMASYVYIADEYIHSHE